MLNLVKHGSDAPKLVVEGLSFLRLGRAEDLREEVLLNHDGILLDSAEAGLADALIGQVRGHVSERVSMLPLFADAGLKGRLTGALDLDGFSDGIHFGSMAEVSRNINRRLGELGSWTPGGSFELDTLLRLARFQYSRDKVLEPLTSRLSSIGYRYPYLSTLVGKGREQEMLQVIAAGIREGYLAGKLKDKLHLCSNCHGNYLNFRETCTSCNSIDLRTESVIHHFMCAHVAPESDFKQGEELECPKCDKHLRHIGIDYDKPSTMYTCNDCDHTFQTANMEAQCMDCGHSSSLENLKEVSLFTTELTAKGEHLAKTGFLKKAAPADPMADGVINLNFFGLVLKQEGERVRLKRTESTVGHIHLTDETLLRLGEKLQETLQNEISSITRNYLQGPDILAAEHLRSYFFLLPDCTPEDGEKTADLIRYNLGKLLGDNLGIDPATVQVAIRAVEPGMTLNNLRHA